MSYTTALPYQFTLEHPVMAYPVIRVSEGPTGELEHEIVEFTLAQSVHKIMDNHAGDYKPLLQTCHLSKSAPATATQSEFAVEAPSLHPGNEANLQKCSKHAPASSSRKHKRIRRPRSGAPSPLPARTLANVEAVKPAQVTEKQQPHQNQKPRVLDYIGVGSLKDPNSTVLLDDVYFHVTSLPLASTINSYFLPELRPFGLTTVKTRQQETILVCIQLTTTIGHIVDSHYVNLSVANLGPAGPRVVLGAQWMEYVSQLGIVHWIPSK